MRGRRPKPTVVKQVEGNPGKRSLAKVDLTSDPAAPPCPTWLDFDARLIWKEQVKELMCLKMLRRVDQIALACLCDSVANLKSGIRRLLKLKAQLRNQGKDPDDALLSKTPGGAVIQSPLLAIINREKVNVQRFASEFGMTPAARARLLSNDFGAAGDQDAKYEELLSEEREGYDDDELPEVIH